MYTPVAADVAKLRNTTGAGMMDCKKALIEAEGDFEKAIEILIDVPTDLIFCCLSYFNY